MVAALVVFPDAEATAITGLAAGLTSLGTTVDVSKLIANPRPDSFVTVRRTGGVRSEMVVDLAQLTIGAWALSDADAMDLGQLCRSVINTWRGTVISGVAISHVVEVSFYPSPDPLSNQPRVLQTVQVAMRGRSHV